MSRLLLILALAFVSLVNFPPTPAEACHHGRRPAKHFVENVREHRQRAVQDGQFLFFRVFRNCG